MHTHTQSSIKDYIGFFEPLVIMAVKQFPYTSSSLLQQRVLFLIVQLLQLKVGYVIMTSCDIVQVVGIVQNIVIHIVLEKLGDHSR